MAPEAPKSSTTSPSQADHPPSVHASHPALAPFPYPGAPYPPIPAGAYPPFVYAAPTPDGHHDPNAANGAPPPAPFYMAYPPPPPGMIYAFPAPPPGANGQGIFENNGVICGYKYSPVLLIS